MTINILSPTDIQSTRRMPLDIAFVLDRSDSMLWRNKMRLMKDAVLSATYHLFDFDRIALVGFDNEVEILLDLIPATELGQRQMEQAVDSVEVLGRTNFCGGWWAACELLTNAQGGDDSRVQWTVVLTDGLANRGETDPHRLFQQASELRYRGIYTAALAAGPLLDEFLLRGIAEAGGSSYGYIDSTVAALDFFEHEIERLTVVGGVTLQDDRKSW